MNLAMKFTLLATILLSINQRIDALPLESTTIQPFSSSSQDVYVLSALEHHEKVPSNGIELKPDDKHTDIPDDHILKKKIVALPINEVKAHSIKVLTNELGQVVLAHSTDTSDEDMDAAASSIVFRPLFTYRRQQAARRRFYVPASTYNYRRQALSNQEYVPNCNRRKHYSQDGTGQYNRPYRNIISDGQPDWYTNGQFPALI